MRMSTRLRRTATVAATSAALLLGGTAASGPASAGEVTVPGCFGAVIIYCNPTLEYYLPYSVTTSPSTVPVCAGTCVDVPVPVPSVTSHGDARVCVTARDRNGNTNLNTCTPIAAPRALRCSSPATGYYVVDGNGNMVLDACVYTGDVPRPAAAVCYDYWTGQPNGVTVYDRNSGYTYINCP